MPKNIKDHEIWKRAKKEATDQYGYEKPSKDRFYAIVQKIYQSMGGEYKHATEEYEKEGTTLTEQDIETYATEEEKEFLEESKRLERCIRKVKAKGTAEDPWAVCVAATGEKKKKGGGWTKGKKVKKEDIEKYGTEEERAFLLEYFNYSSLVDPKGHMKCPKCGGTPHVGSRKNNVRRTYHILCDNYCGIIGDGATEKPVTKYHSVDERMEDAINRAWDKWDAGEVVDWGKIRGK